MAGKISTGGGKRDAGTINDPNVIPFIDIMLVLLIIFMVTAPIPTVDVRVDLPPRNPIPLRTVGLNPTFVELFDGGGVAVVNVDGERTSIDALGLKVLERVRINNPALPPSEWYSEARIFLRADQNAPYGMVIEVMSKLQEEGFAKVGIFAEQAQL
jgi:biopolymer transport protein ExbD